jgi:subtilisin family serine protease
MYFNPGELLIEVSLRRVCLPAPGGPIMLVDSDLNGDGAIDVNDYDVTSADGTGPSDGVITLADFNATPYRERINDALNTLNGSTRPLDQVIILEDLLRPNTGSRTTESCGLFENLQDDDGDSRIDDLVGWNFVMGDNWAYTPVAGAPDPSVPRPNISSHGTLVAGVIAAAANERSFLTPRLDLESYVGVAPMTRILPLAMLDSRPGEGGEDLTTEAGFEGWMDRMVEALDYAVQHNAHIINASWSIKCAPAKDGIPRALVCTDADRNAKERRFQAAFDELDAVGLDRVLVVTSGVDFFVDLDRADVQDLPGELHRPNFIMVTASNEMDVLNDTVSFGDETYDLAAPGFRLPWLSALGRTTDPLGNPISGLLTEGGRLVRISGTSVAAPQVAGAAAMLMSACPALQGNPIRVRQILIENAECGLPGLSGRVRGACRLDVRRAVQAVLPERGGSCP